MTTLLMQLKKDWSLSATIAGFLAVLISYSGPLVIFFQAAHQANVSPTMVASWIFGISLGAAIPGIYLSIKYKIPVITAWSAPGTALLVTLFPNISLPEVVGAYITCAVALLIIGITGYFDKLLKWIPQAIAAGMMAGILFQFGVGLFKAADGMPLIVLVMMLVYLIAKRVNPRYSMIWVLVSGILLSFVLGKLNPISVNVTLTQPAWILPNWTVASTVNFALPLLLVSLTGQFLPGMAIFRLNHYEMSAKPIITMTSLSSLVVACMGGITIVLASITAALCMGEHCHEDPKRRYIGGVVNGLFYILGGLFAGSIVGLFGLFPKELVAALAGLALLGAISSNITVAMQDDTHKEAALLTFLTTVSGLHLFGLSSVFWGVVVGIVAYLLTVKSKAPSFKG